MVENLQVNSGKAWEQWGGKSNTSSGTNAIQSIMRGEAPSILSTPGSWKFWENDDDVDETDLEDQATEESSAVKESLMKFWKGPSQSSGPQSASQFNWNKRFKIFVAMILLSSMFFGMSFVFIPLIIVRPSKFALSFTLGSVCFMCAFAMLKGPSAYLKSLIEPKYILFSGLYITSLGFTLYSCLILGSYILVICSSTLQFIALIWYGLSALPGGSRSIKAFGKMFWKTSSLVLKSCFRFFSK